MTHTATQRARGELLWAAQNVRLELATAATVREAYAIWEHVRAMATLMEQLTNEAGKRCDALLLEKL